MALPEHRSIPRALEFFARDLREKIQQSLDRAAPHRTMVNNILREFDLPSGIAYLPVIESAYVPTITSRAGARGIWQFVPGTARDYGLRVDWWIDERADPEQSTRAAAAYFKDLYERFDDWPLALAAYNAGPGRIGRLMTKHGADTFWELLDWGVLPKETRGYVPTFYATLMIATNPEEYGFHLRGPTPSDRGTVTIEGPVSLLYIANVIGADERVLEEMNPALNQKMIPPGPQKVNVPLEAVHALQARASTLRYEDQYVSAAIYTATHGESIATIAKRFRLDRSTIRGMNNVRGDATTEGQRIYLPMTPSELSFRLAPRDTLTSDFYTVKAGDTLQGIATRAGLSLSELVTLNEISSHTVIYPGDQLRLRSDASSNAPPSGLP